MVFTEINPRGNYDCWEPSKLKELKKREISESLGQKLLFENVNIKVWEIILCPGERLPFRKISKNYTFSSMTDGLGISRCTDGRISLVRLKKGEPTFMNHEDKACIYDFENIGENILFLHAMEFRPLIEGTITEDIGSL